MTDWGAGFLGATYQGTYLRSGTTPILHLEAPEDFPPPLPADNGVAEIPDRVGGETVYSKHGRL